MPHHAHLQARRIGGDHRAEQHDDPAEVDPDQEDRHRREGAVDHRVGRHLRRRTSRARAWPARSRPRRTRRRPARGASARACSARSGTAPPCRRPAATNSSVSSSRPTPPGSAPTKPRDAEIAYDVSVRLDAEQQRPERHRGPVDEHALRDRPRLAHAPDRVERAVDRQHQRERGDDQHHQADGAEPVRLAGELRQRQPAPAWRWCRAPGSAGSTSRSATWKRREHREGREHRQHHRDQRHQRDQRREGQAARGEAEPVFAKALAQRAQRCRARASAAGSATQARDTARASSP